VLLVLLLNVDWHILLILIIPVIISFVVLDEREYLIPLGIYVLADLFVAYFNAGLNTNTYISIFSRLFVLVISGEVILYQKRKSNIASQKLKSSEKELLSSERKFQSLLNYTYDWEYYLTAEGKIEYSSLSCVYQTQYTHEEFIENPDLLLEIVHPEDKERVKEHYLQELNNERPKPIEFKILKKNGDFRVLRHTCNPVMDENGTFIGVRVTNRNATDRWKAEQKVRDNERKYRYIFENLLDVYYRTSIDGTIEIISPSVEKISGYKVEELIGQDSSIFYQDMEGRNRFLEMIYQQKEVRNYEIRFIDKSGESKILSFNSKLIFDENDKPIAIEGIFRDVTLEYTIKKELEDEKNKFKTLFETNLAGVYITTVEGTVLECNLAIARMFGYNSIEEIKSLDARELYLDVEHREDFLRKLKHKKVILSNEFPMKRKDGSVIWVLENCRLLDDGKLMGTLIDITELKNTIHKLKESEEHLREANATKDRFFSIIAHDVRSPFTSLLGLSSLLIDEWDSESDEEKKMLMSTLRSSIEKTYKLINGLLEWSRIQTNRIEFEPDDFVLKDLADSLIYLYKLQTKEKKISIESKIDPSIKVFTDENMLSTVLRNLISNALKFTPVGGTITVYAEKDGDYTKVCVEDSGIGIEPDTVKKLFKISEKVSTLGTEGETGTGLGLILCAELVKKIGGKIWVESDLGKGTKFYFTIPNND